MTYNYSAIYDVFKSYNMRNPEHAHKTLPKVSGKERENSKSLRKDLYEAIETIYTGIGDDLSKNRGVTLIIDASDLRTIPEALIRKSLLFGTTTVLLVKSAKSVQLSRTKGASFGTEYEYYIPQEFVSFLLKYQSLVQDNLVLPLPASLKSLAWSKSSYELSGLSQALPVTLKNDTLSAHLSEEEKNTSSKGYANILLPALSNRSINEIHTFRIKEAESFQRFHSQLNKLLKESKATSSEDKLLELMDETDQQVRQLHSKINSLSKTRFISGAQILAGFTAACLCAFIPNGLSPLLTGVFGTKSFTDGLAFFTDFRKEYDEIHRSNFYFPWKIGFG